MQGLALVTAFAVLAGCLGGSDASQTQPTPAPSDDPVTESTGAIEATVVTAEFAPVVGAQVVLQDLDQTQISDDRGSSLFPRLQPGAYTLLAAKAGYRAVQPQGLVVDVEAGKLSSAKLVLEPVPVVTAETSYHKSLLFKGFISCSAEWVRVATLVNRSQCGKGVNAAGQTVGADPNENATHLWNIENVQIQTIIMEAEWLPSIDAIGGELYFATHSAYSCAATSCQYNNELLAKGGRSPVYVAREEGAAHNITRAYGGVGATFPTKAWTVGRTFCEPGCAASVTFQQNYEVMVSAFYGLEAPAGWKSRPGS